VTVRHTETLCEAVAGLLDEDAVEVEAAGVPFAAGRDYTAFARKVRREVLASDSRTVEERFRAAIEDRRVWCGPNLDGATQTFGAALAAEGAQTLLTAVNTAVNTAANTSTQNRPAGDLRSLTQRQADGLVQIPQDWLNGIASGGKHVGKHVGKQVGRRLVRVCRSPSPPPPCSDWTTNPPTSTGTARSPPPWLAKSRPTRAAPGGG
jgi:hypothetical protein